VFAFVLVCFACKMVWALWCSALRAVWVVERVFSEGRYWITFNCWLVGGRQYVSVLPLSISIGFTGRDRCISWGLCVVGGVSKMSLR